MSDPTFDDWFKLRPDFSRALVHIGNTRGLGLGVPAALGGGAVLTVGDLEENELDLNDHTQASGPLDLEAPLIDILSPAPGSSALQGADLTVTVTATDNVSLTPPMVSFDIDGSGAIDATGESVTATPSGPDQFDATFLTIAGLDGKRDISETVSDSSGHIDRDIQPFFVPEPSPAASLLCGVALLVALGRRREGARDA